MKRNGTQIVLTLSVQAVIALVKPCGCTAACHQRSSIFYFSFVSKIKLVHVLQYLLHFNWKEMVTTKKYPTTKPLIGH